MEKLSYYIIFILLLSCASEGDAKLKSKNHNIKKEYYDNGSLMYESSYKYNRLDGISKTWDENGDY